MDDDFPPLNPADFPPQLKEALRRMSLRGDVIDLATKDLVARDGHLVTDTQEAPPGAMR
jgi:hypothetical protein